MPPPPVNHAADPATSSTTSTTSSTTTSSVYELLQARAGDVQVARLLRVLDQLSARAGPAAGAHAAEVAACRCLPRGPGGGATATACAIREVVLPPPGSGPPPAFVWAASSEHAALQDAAAAQGEACFASPAARAAWMEWAMRPARAAAVLDLAWWAIAALFQPGHPHARAVQDAAVAAAARHHAGALLPLRGARGDAYQRLWGRAAPAAAAALLRAAFPRDAAAGELGAGFEARLARQLRWWTTGALPGEVEEAAASSPGDDGGIGAATGCGKSLLLRQEPQPSGEGPLLRAATVAFSGGKTSPLVSQMMRRRRAPEFDAATRGAELQCTAAATQARGGSEDGEAGSGAAAAPCSLAASLCVAAAGTAEAAHMARRARLQHARVADRRGWQRQRRQIDAEAAAMSSERRGALADELAGLRPKADDGGGGNGGGNGSGNGGGGGGGGKTATITTLSPAFATLFGRAAASGAAAAAAAASDAAVKAQRVRCEQEFHRVEWRREHAVGVWQRRGRSLDAVMAAAAHASSLAKQTTTTAGHRVHGVGRDAASAASRTARGALRARA